MAVTRLHFPKRWDEVFEEIDQLDEQMSNYKPESELSAINRDAAQHDVTVSPQLFRLIQYSLRASQESGGDFDITVGPLMKLWGFFRGQGRLPSHSGNRASRKRESGISTCTWMPRAARFALMRAEWNLTWGALPKATRWIRRRRSCAPMASLRR